MKIYVGNLAEQTTENELRETFAPYGQISRVAIIADKQSGLPRGFGFVEMDRAEEGEAAIAELHGTLLRDRALKVKDVRKVREARKAKEARSQAESNGKHRSSAGRN